MTALTTALRDPSVSLPRHVSLRQQSIDIESINVQKPSLDEVFFALTGHDTGQDNSAHDGDPTTEPTPELEAVR